MRLFRCIVYESIYCSLQCCCRTTFDTFACASVHWSTTIITRATVGVCARWLHLSHLQWARFCIPTEALSKWCEQSLFFFTSSLPNNLIYSNWNQYTSEAESVPNRARVTQDRHFIHFILIFNFEDPHFSGILISRNFSFSLFTWNPHIWVIFVYLLLFGVVEFFSTSFRCSECFYFVSLPWV